MKSVGKSHAQRPEKPSVPCQTLPTDTTVWPSAHAPKRPRHDQRAQFRTHSLREALFHAVLHQFSNHMSTSCPRIMPTPTHGWPAHARDPCVPCASLWGLYTRMSHPLPRTTFTPKHPHKRFQIQAKTALKCRKSRGCTQGSITFGNCLNKTQP